MINASDIQEAIEYAIRSNAVEGLITSKETQALLDRVVAGELTFDEVRQLIDIKAKSVRSDSMTVLELIRKLEDTTACYNTPVRVVVDGKMLKITAVIENTGNISIVCEPIGIHELTGKEQEALFQKGIKKVIAEQHAAGQPTTHGDDKGVYKLYPDGRKGYTKLY